MNNEQNSTKTNINWYPGHMAKAKRLIQENLKYIDLVYEVVDARIPYSSKLIDIDQYTVNKPRLMIMTKYDLCDKQETKRWISYYEKQGYEVLPIDLMQESPKKIIIKTLEMVSEMNQKRREKGMNDRRARILVVGIPNVGKSTLINRLVGKKVATTGNKPGVTKNLDWIRIHDQLELLDSPGILWPKFEEKVALNLASFTAIKEEILPIGEVAIYILNMLEAYYPSILKERYGVDQLEEDIGDTFDQIGKKRGCLQKGGYVDYDKVCALILQDMKEGKITSITFDRIDKKNKL